MADDPSLSNEVVDGGDASDLTDYEQASTVVAQDTTAAAFEDYADDEPIEDYVVKMVVDDGAALSPDLVNAGIADFNNNVNGGRTSLYDSVTTALYDELNGNGTAITGGKRWWGWSWQKTLLFGFIALCILGIILAVLFLVFGKKLKNKKRTPAAGSSTTTKAVVTKGISPDPKYQPVPNV